MYGNDASIRFSPGISTPSNRGIFNCEAFQAIQSAGADGPPGLALSLFVPWILTNHADHISSFYNSAAFTKPLNRRSYFHPNSSSGDKKTQPEEIPSQERFSFTLNLTFGGRLFALSSNRKATSLP